MTFTLCLVGIIVVCCKFLELYDLICLIPHAHGNEICFDDIIGIFLIIIFSELVFVELTLLPIIWVLLEAASLFSDHLILVNNSLGTSWRSEGSLVAL